MRNFLDVSSVCGRAAKKSARPTVAAAPSVAIALVKKHRRSDMAISHLQGFSTGISELDFSFVHRILLLHWTQRICRQRGSQVRLQRNEIIGMWESAPLVKKSEYPIRRLIGSWAVFQNAF